MDATITAPAGADTYTDAMGRTQWRVTGPNGTFLVTRASRYDSWQVWRSNGLTTAYRGKDLQRALDAAARLAGRPGQDTSGH